MKSLIKPLGMLGLTAAASATDAAINKKEIGSGGHTTLITSNDDMEDLLKIVKSLEDKKKMKLKSKEVVFLVCYLVHLVQVY